MKIQKVNIELLRYFIELVDVGNKTIKVIFDCVEWYKSSLDAEDGELIGKVWIEYPIADMNVLIDLDVICRYDENALMPFAFPVVKIPFVLPEINLDGVLGSSRALIEDGYEQCSCGGIIKPVYDDFDYPTLVRYCNKCEWSNENLEDSPIAI